MSISYFSEFATLILNEPIESSLTSANLRVATCHNVFDGIRLNTGNPYSNNAYRTQQVTCKPDETVLFKIDRFDTEKNSDFLTMTTGDNNEIMRMYLLELIYSILYYFRDRAKSRNQKE